MIYAKVDVKLRDHTRAHRAGSAMATWTWALLYAREQETDGYIADEMIRLAWSGEAEARKHAKKLVDVGLWERDEAGPDGGGWRICRYADKNETRAEIDVRRTTDKTRKKSARAPVSARTPSGLQPDSVRASKDSVVGIPGSGSGSGSESRSEDPPRSPPADDGLVRPDLPLEADARARYETVAASSALDTPVEVTWLAFCGHHGGSRFGGRAGVLGRFQKWCTDQVQRDATARTRRRDEAERAEKRDATFAAERKAGGSSKYAPADPAPAPYYAAAKRAPADDITEAEQRKTAALVAEQMATLFADPSNDATPRSERKPTGTDE